MEEKELRRMIESFFEAALSPDEERLLCNYLCSNDVPASLLKDKELILSLCNEPQECPAMPAGAAERLEAMLDDAELQANKNNTGIRRKSPWILWYAATIAAACIAAIVLFYNDGTSMQCDETVQYEAYERDTYSTPQEAMQCMQAVLGDLKLSASNTQKNIQAVSAGLKQSTFIHCYFNR
jgi:hypothetical protein